MKHSAKGNSSLRACRRGSSAVVFIDTGLALRDSLAFDLMYLACLSFRGNQEAESACVVVKN